jgi:hypothetical protein
MTMQLMTKEPNTRLTTPESPPHIDLVMVRTMARPCALFLNRALAFYSQFFLGFFLSREPLTVSVFASYANITLR